MSKYLAILTITITILSCKKETIQHKKSSIDHNDNKKIIEKNIQTNNDSKLYSILNEIEKNEVSILNLLKNTSKEEANLLYEKLEQFNSKKIVELSEIEGQLLDKFVNFYDEKTHKIIIPDSVQTKYNALTKHKIEFWEIGEGYTELRFKANYYYTIFKGKLTNDYDYYVKIKAIEDEDLYSADAGIAISWQAVSERILHWETFITQYPNSKFYNDAKSTYYSYLSDYIFGQDNTPSIEDDKTRFYKENLDEYNRFILANPDSKTTIFLKLIITNFNTHKSAEILHRFYENENSKIFP